MSRRMIKYLSYIIIVLYSVSCKDEPNEDDTFNFTVSLKQASAKTKGIKAYIFINDSLYGITNDLGIFESKTIAAGTYKLTCSAINFRDTSLTIRVLDSTSNKFEYKLKAETLKGKVYGEFQENGLFIQKVVAKPEMLNWTPKQVFDGVSGATIHKMGLKREIPERTIYIGDSLVAKTDGFGQFWFSIQNGTYRITGTCGGYRSKSYNVIVNSDTVRYTNIFLERDSSSLQ